MSDVYISHLGVQNDGSNTIDRIGRLFDRAGFGDLIEPGDLTAIKMHFGEKGTDTYLKPVFVRKVVDRVRSRGGIPFLTDTNALYPGSARMNAVEHLETAYAHGFVPTVVDAPVIIGGGLVGGNFVEVQIPGTLFSKVKVAREYRDADSLLVLSHFKGHGWAGFGGAIKNLGMGGTPPEGKRDVHRITAPMVGDGCQGCGECVSSCGYGAIAVIDDIAQIDHRICGGCGRCIGSCKHGALGYDYDHMDDAMRALVEHAMGVVAEKTVGYINFLIDVTPFCDCAGSSDYSIVPDIGILASTDPVAIDLACLELVNGQTGMANSRLGSKLPPGEDKFLAMFPRTRARIQLEYGELIGLGSLDYRLVEV